MEAQRIDPRIVRTRTALREALARLLHERAFDDITLQDIADRAGLNRATIYKHHPDKNALLDAWIADDLQKRLLEATNATCSADNPNAGMLETIVTTACECMSWVNTLGRPDDRLLRLIAGNRLLELLRHVVVFALEQKVLLAVGKADLVEVMSSAALQAAATAWANGGHHTPRALSSHVNNTIAGLASLVVPNPKPVRVKHSFSFDDR